MSDLQSTQPCPIKVTDSISNSDRANVKALENAKTGKVSMLKADQLMLIPKICAKKTKLESKSKKLGLN
jgi:hypothetical protein